MPRGSQKSFWLRLLCSNSAISARHCSRVRCNRLIVLPPFKLNLVVAYGFKLWLNRCGCCYGYFKTATIWLSVMRLLIVKLLCFSLKEILRASCIILRGSYTLLLVAYLVTESLGIPLSFVTATAALVLMAVAGRWWRAGSGALISVRTTLRGAPWQIVIFSIGMYLVVYGLGNAGLTDYGAQTLQWFARQGDFVATVGTGFLTAVVASVMNNLPSTLVGVLAIEQADIPPITQELMIYANVIGNDLGPKFTPIGSLATLLWLHVLARKGYKISWGQYMKIGLLITPPVLLATLVALALWLPVVSAS